MIARIGTSPMVRIYPTEQARGTSDFIEERVNIVSDGPPGVIGCWGRADGRWYLVREAPDSRGGKLGQLEAVEGDRG